VKNPPVIEIRSVHDTIEAEPYFSGNEDTARKWLMDHSEWDVWLSIANGDGTVENITLEEFLEF
jgi:hypothetical protein